MSDPSDFVSWADYMALNQDAGQEMLGKTMSAGDQQLADAQRMSDAHYNAARGAGEGEDGGVFESTGEAVRKGLASYGEFMQGMADPGARQALMEKVYGKGAVSALDSALMGGAGAGRIAEGQKSFRDATTRFESRNMDADARRGRYKQQTSAQSAEDERVRASKQAEAEAREKDALGRKYWIERNTAPDSVRHSQDWTQRDKEMYMTSILGTGKIDWDAHFAKWKRAQQQAYENRPKTFWGGEIDLGLGNAGKAPGDEDTWASYYARNRTGAK